MNFPRSLLRELTSQRLNGLEQMAQLLLIIND